MSYLSQRLATWVISASFALTLVAPALAQNVEAPQQVASIEGITEYRFKNGVRLLLFPDPSASTVTVNMTVFVGSRMEGYGETGMAHLLEHMLFKGSKNFPNPDKTLNALGADYNGTTWVDRTNYYETMPATDKNLETAIKFEADRLVNCFVKREDLATEMTVVRNEFEMGENNPENILNQRMYAIAYEWHNYGKSTIGNRADIERVPIDRLQTFYKKYYQPDNMMLIIAGKFDEAKALQLVGQHFATLKAPNRLLELTYTEEPPQDGERTVTLHRVGKVPVVGALYHVPAAAHPDHPALRVLDIVLGTAPSGRLYKALVETKKASKVSSDVSDWHDPGIFEVFAVVAEKVSPEEVRDIMLDVTQGVPQKPVTQEEINRAVKKYLSNREQALAKSQRIAIELSEWAGAGDWRLLFVERDRVAKVTPEDVNRVAAKYLQTPNRTVGVFVPATQPTKTPIPEAPAVAKLVENYKGGKALSKGETFDPTPANIEGRLKRTTLSNGLKVAFLPKKTRGETVVGRFDLHFGNSKSLQGHNTASVLLGSLMMRGTEKKSRQEIQDTLDKLSSSLSVGSSAGSLTTSFSTKNGQLSALLELAREVLREPSFPDNELDILKRNQLQGLEKGLVDPQALAIRWLIRKLNPYPPDDIRYQPTIQESIDRVHKVSRDEIQKIYREQIGATHGELVLVGEFDPDAVVPQLEKIFAGWKSSVPYERIARTAHPDIAGTRETIEVPDKENAVFFAGLQFPLRDDEPEYAAAEVGNYILGGSGFTSRLMDRLRQKEGWSYGAGSRLTVDSQDRLASLLVYAIYNPTVADKVEKGAREEITKLLTKGISEEEIKSAKQGFLEELKVERGKDGALAGILASNLHLGRTFQYYADLEKKVESLTPAEITEVLGRYVDPNRLVAVRAGDFSKKGNPEKK